MWYLLPGLLYIYDWSHDGCWEFFLHEASLVNLNCDLVNPKELEIGAKMDGRAWERYSPGRGWQLSGSILSLMVDGERTKGRRDTTKSSPWEGKAEASSLRAEPRVKWEASLTTLDLALNLDNFWRILKFSIFMYVLQIWCVCPTLQPYGLCIGSVLSKIKVTLNSWVIFHKSFEFPTSRETLGQNPSFPYDNCPQILLRVSRPPPVPIVFLTLKLHGKCHVIGFCIGHFFKDREICLCTQVGK